MRGQPDNSEVERLRRILSGTVWLMEILRTVRHVNPANWVVGSGVIRSIVWDRLHEFDKPTLIRDIDVAYFDNSDLTRERDDAFAAQLRDLRADVPWEVTNQASVHLWYEATFGHPIPPARSIEDAVGMWPETATAVAVRLQPDDSLYVVAPCGLTDLLGLRLRRNTRQVSREFFRQRLREKRVEEIWPRVTVVDE